MRRSEQKVAQFVLSNPSEVVYMRIIDLAQASQVSEPTVIRFCRSVGCSGFQQFKLTLAQQVAADYNAAPTSLDAEDSLRELGVKIFNATLSSLVQIRDSLDPKSLEQASKIIGDAVNVECIGYGGSHPIALDAQIKLFRLGITASCNADSHIQHMAAMSLGVRNVVLAISQSGRTLDLLQVVNQAKISGAKIIGIAPGDTPLEKLCDVFLVVNSVDSVNSDDNQQNIAPLPSRIAHMLVLDILVTSLVLQLGRSGSKHLEQMQELLSTLKADS